MPRKPSRIRKQAPIEPEHYEGAQYGAAAGVAWVPRMQLREAVAAKDYNQNYSLEKTVRGESRTGDRRTLKTAIPGTPSSFHGRVHAPRRP